MESVSQRKERGNSLIVIVGATALGKSDLAVRLSKTHGGEIVSADSRQVYRRMDIGSGKITKKEMFGVPHHLLDVASPKRRFTVLQYQKLAQKAIDGILKRNKVPFLVGGSAFYVYAVIDGLVFPQVKASALLRKRLEQQSTEDLLLRLKFLDSRRARAIEPKNRRRLIRALEIVLSTRKPVPKLKKQPPPFDILILGIKKSEKELKERIKKRLNARLQEGMIEEIRKLKASGLSWKRLEEFGLEYRFIAQYLQDKISYMEMKSTIQKETERFAKYQMRWFKKDKRIHWIKNYREAKNLLNEGTATNRSTP